MSCFVRLFVADFVFLSYLWKNVFVFTFWRRRCSFSVVGSKKRCMSLIFAIFELNLHRFVYLCMSVCGAGTVL